MALATAVGRALGPLLYKVTPSDPVTLLPVAGLMLAVTLLGGWVPARRDDAADAAATLHRL